MRIFLVKKISKNCSIIEENSAYEYIKNVRKNLSIEEQAREYYNTAMILMQKFGELKAEFSEYKRKSDKKNSELEKNFSELQKNYSTLKINNEKLLNSKKNAIEALVFL